MTDTIRDIEYQVTPMNPSGAGFIGDGWIKDEASGLVFILIEQGDDLADLRRAVSETLDVITEYVRDTTGLNARLVGKGWDPKNPPHGPEQNPSA